MISARALSRRNIHEKQVIALLRGGTCALRHRPDVSKAFDRLASMARLCGLTIFPPDSRFVSDGEVELLSNLAAAQRLTGRPSITMDDRGLATLLPCSALLCEMGIRLPVAALQTAASPPIGRQLALSARDHAANGMVRARALSFVRTCAVASTDDFARIGVSRQSVSRLCRDGLIQRIRHGWYRAAPPGESVTSLQS